MPVELVLDVGAQPEHRALHDPGEQRTPGSGTQHRGRDVDARARRTGSCAACVKSMPFPLVTPSTMMLVALPRIFGAMTSSVTLATARISTTRDAETLGPQPGREAPGRVLEVLRPLERHARPRPTDRRTPPPRVSSGGLTGSAPDRRSRSVRGSGRSRRRRAASRSGSCRLLLGELRRDDLGVRRAGLEQLVVRAEPDLAAVLDHEDLVGVDDGRDPLGDDHGHRVARRRARARRAGARRSRGRGRRTSRRRGRCRAGGRARGRWRGAGADRRRRSSRPARSARRGRRASRRRSRGPARSRARARARRRWRRGSRSGRLLATVPENRYGFCGTRPMRLHSSSGSMSRTSCAVDEHRAAGRVEEPRHQVQQRRLARAGAADDRGRLARRRP